MAMCTLRQIPSFSRFAQLALCWQQVVIPRCQFSGYTGERRQRIVWYTSDVGASWSGTPGKPKSYVFSGAHAARVQQHASEDMHCQGRGLAVRIKASA